jgi:predicted Zn finger-like uncharacterized protein
MIVKCEQCDTKFKIPDDKVSEKGVKVRCTKCGHTFRVAKPAAPSAAPSVGTPQKVPPLSQTVALDSADPFSKFGDSRLPPADEQTRPGVFALGVEASRIGDLGRPSRPTAGAAAPFDFASLAPAPETRPATQASTAPFDFATLMGPPAAAPARPAAGPAPFDFSALTAPAAAPTSPAPQPPPRTSPPARPVDAPSMSFDFSSLGSPPAPAVHGSPPPPPAMLPDVPDEFPPPSSAPVAPPPLGDDLFASASMQNPTLPSVSAHASKEEARNALFDMSAAVPPEVLEPFAPPPPLDDVPVGASISSPSSFAAPVPKPPDPALERGRRALGIVVNVVIAVVLVVGLVVVGTATATEGKLDVPSVVATLKSLVAPASTFTPEDISNGLYETKMGRPVFFVRGLVTNRSGTATRVKVKAELLDGSTLVRAAEVMAGMPPTPEELYRIDQVAQLKTLMERTSTKAPVVEAGSAVPFVVAFAEYPPDLKAFRVRVTASPEGPPTAAVAP